MTSVAAASRSDVGRTMTCVVTTDGVTLAVRDHGPRGASCTVVFLHGLCLSQYEWSDHRDYVANSFGSSVRVISYDHRGHGHSGSAPVSTYSIDQLADDLLQVLTALGVTGRVILVGHSMGGMAALCFAARAQMVEHPFEVVGMVLCATAAGRLAQRGLGRMLTIPALGALAAAVDHAPSGATRALAAPLAAVLGRLRHHGRASQQALIAVAADALSTAALATAVGFLPSLRRFDQYEALPGIRARTVIISGADDILTPPAHAAEMVAAMPRAVHVPVPGVGHMLPQEAPQCVKDAVSRTLRAAQVPSQIRRRSAVVGVSAS